MMNMWKPIGLTNQGDLNVERNIDCQNVVASYVKNGISVIALSDAANIKDFSLDGANIVAPAVCKFVANNFAKLFTEQDIYEAKKIILEDLTNRLAKRAKKFKTDITEFASTLLFVAIKEGRQCIIGHIGDGVIWREENNDWSIVSNEEQNNSINEMDLVTGQNVYVRMKMYREDVNDLTSFALLSNGFSNGIFDDNLINVSSLSKIIKENVNTVYNTLVDTLENKVKEITRNDCGVIYLSKVKNVGIYEELEYEEKQEIFEKHYTHLYNTEAAIEDASYIIKVLKTTNGNVQYISKKSKVALATCKKITTILSKANYLHLNDDVFSLVKKEDLND